MNQTGSSADANLGMSERVFNDDFLINPGDFQHGQHQFPEVFDILDHPELREEFRKYDRIANKAKVHVRWIGIFAVVSASVALLSAATEALWQEIPCAASFRVVFEFSGLIAAIIASGSLWLGPWQKRWLQSRFMTERLRQWHFQLLVCKGSEIETFLNQYSPDSKEAFRKQRKIWFDDFLHEYSGKLDSRMDSLASDPDFASDWLHRSTNYTHNSSGLAKIMEPYRSLRLDHQYDYATHKLSEATDRPFWQFLEWPLLRQDSVIRAAVSFCFVVAILCSIGIIVNRYFGQTCSGLISRYGGDCDSNSWNCFPHGAGGCQTASAASMAASSWSPIAVISASIGYCPLPAFTRKRRSGFKSWQAM